MIKSFKNQVRETVEKNSSTAEEVFRFSDQMLNIIGFDPEEIKAAISNRTFFKVEGTPYWLSFENRHFSEADGWCYVLEVKTEEGEWVPYWAEHNGTKTINLPPKKVREEVLNALLKMVG